MISGRWYCSPTRYYNKYRRFHSCAHNSRLSSRNSPISSSNRNRCQDYQTTGIRSSLCTFSSTTTSSGGGGGGGGGSDSRPFNILGLQQVAVGSTDAESMKALWVNVLGLRKVGEYSSDKENVNEDILKLGSDNNGSVSVEIDLMCPIDEDGSPKVHKPPLNHIGLWVDNLEVAVEWMESHGVRFTPGGIRKGAAGHNVTFIHPKGNDSFPIGGCGVLIELVQAPQDVIDKLTP